MLLWIGAALLVAVLVVYFLICALLYRRLFVPAPPSVVDDFVFSPSEFGADYEAVDLTTADGINFGAWFFRQPGSPQTIIVSGGHEGQLSSVLGLRTALRRKC